MAKFKNKKTGEVIEEGLNFYINKLRNNPNFKELDVKSESENPKKNKDEKKEEVDNTPQ